MRPSVAFILPALNEEKTIANVLDGLRRQLGAMNLPAAIFVADNGSTDSTAAVAAAHGSTVVRERRRGYGQACLAGMAQLPAVTEIVVFLDADGSDDAGDLPALLAPLLSGEADFVLGSRTIRGQEPGAFSPQQRFGNWLATRLMRLLFDAHYTDLGPFRAIRRTALESLRMRDRNFGWTIEMQIKAHLRRVRTVEVPVRYRRRAGGQSKISGHVWGGILAGAKILWTIARLRIAPGD